MRSDFVIDDLLDPFRDIEDYDVALLGVEEHLEGATGTRSYVLQYTPAAAARVAWGRIVAWVETEAGVPIRQEFYSASGKRLRTLHFSDVRTIGGRRVPHRWKAVPVGGKGRESILEIRELRFEAAFDDPIFSIQNLKPRP